MNEEDHIHKISSAEFIKYFSKNDNNKKPKTVTVAEFIKKATVLVGKNEFLLADYMKRKQITKDSAELIFDNINSKNKYLERFYKTSLAYDENNIVGAINGEMPMKSGEISNNKLIKYKNIIRNMFFMEILKTTKSGFANHPSYFDVLENLYNHWKIDYKLLTPSALYYISAGRIGSVFSSFYFRASIMNPYLVYSMNKSIFHGRRIFTPTLGWGSYYYGFAESGTIKEYVGIDIIPAVCSGVKKFAELYYPQIKTTFYCNPSETLLKNAAFMRKYKGHFDTVFFSPPYFDLEKYPGELQSTMQYPTYGDWLNNYWAATIGVCSHVLKRGGILCYILSDYGSQNNKFNLVEDMNNIVLQSHHFGFGGFSLKEIQPMHNKNVNSTKHRDTDEKIMIFIKKTAKNVATVRKSKRVTTPHTLKKK